MAIRATGKITRIYPSIEGTYIRLEVPAELRPKENYFQLPLDHPNYHALYSLALSSAINGYPLQIRVTGEITPDAYGRVHYMVVDW